MELIIVALLATISATTIFAELSDLAVIISFGIFTGFAYYVLRKTLKTGFKP